MLTVTEFKEYLRQRHTSNADKCLEYMNNNVIQLMFERIDGYNIYFFVCRPKSCGVNVPKYLEEEANRFLKLEKLTGTVFREASFVIIEYLDNGERDIMNESYFFNIYPTYVKTKGFSHARRVSNLCNIAKTADLLYQSLKKN